MSYSPVVLDHFYSPRNCYVMQEADVVGVAGEPGRGNFMVIYLKIEGERIVEASFQTHGCCPSIAAGSLLVDHLAGMSLAKAAEWDEPALNVALGGLPMHKRHCSALAAAALHGAIAAWVSQAGRGEMLVQGSDPDSLPRFERAT